MIKKLWASDVIQVFTFAALGVGLVSLALVITGRTHKLAGEASEERFWTFKVQAARSYDAVVIGDSRAYRGFDPALFSRETGLKIINAGFSSAGFSASLFAIAERHLSPNGAKLIVLAVTPYSLTEEAVKNEHLSQWLGRSRSELITSRYLQSILIYFSPAAVKALSNRKERNPYQQVFFDDGFVESDRPLREVSEGVRSYREQFRSEKVSLRRMKELFNQIKIWQSEGYKVVAYQPPVDPRVRAIEDKYSGWNELEWNSQLNALKVPWLKFDDQKFISYDGSHLTGPSARDLTLEIARWIKTNP